MIYRPPPTEAECVEALEVMIEAYGYNRTQKMLDLAQAHNTNDYLDSLKKEES